MSRRLKNIILFIAGLLLFGNLISSLAYFRSSQLMLWSGDALVRFVVFILSGAYILEFAWDLDDYRPEDGFLSYENVRDASLYFCVIVSALFFYVGIKQALLTDLIGYLDWFLYWGVILFLALTVYHLLRDVSETTTALTDGSQDNPFIWLLAGFMDWVYWGKDRVDEFLGEPSRLSGVRTTDADAAGPRSLRLFAEEGFLPTLEDGKDIRVIFGGILRVLGAVLIAVGLLFVLGFLTTLLDYLWALDETSLVIDPFFGVGLGIVQGLLLAYGVALFAYALGKTFLLRGDRLFGVRTSRYEVLPTIGEVVTYLVEYIKLLGECLFLSGIATMFILSVWVGFEFLYALLNLIFFVQIPPFLPYEGFIERTFSWRLVTGIGYWDHFRLVVYGFAAGIGAATAGFLSRVFYYVIAEFIHGLMNVTDSVWAFLIQMEWGRWISTGEEQ